MITIILPKQQLFEKGLKKGFEKNMLKTGDYVI